jgi:hypothetical protein
MMSKYLIFHVIVIIQDYPFKILESLHLFQTWSERTDACIQISGGWYQYVDIHVCFMECKI